MAVPLVVNAARALNSLVSVLQQSILSIGFGGGAWGAATSGTSAVGCVGPLSMIKLPSAVSIGVFLYAPDAYLAYGLWLLSPVPISLPTAIALARVIVNLITNMTSQGITLVLREKAEGSRIDYYSRYGRNALHIDVGPSKDQNPSTTGAKVYQTVSSWALQASCAVRMLFWETLYSTRMATVHLRPLCGPTRYVL